jgi:RHS repeat-associated protein
VLYGYVSDQITDLVIYFAGRPVAVLTVAGGGQQGLTYVTTDHLGTPGLATDAAGVAFWSGGFEPFGEDWNGAGAAGIFLRFPGQWTDEVWQDAGLGADIYYNVHRWYDYLGSRYSSPDPAGLAAGVNLYSYAQQNPVNFRDVLGLARKTDLRNAADAFGHFAFGDGSTRTFPFSRIPTDSVKPSDFPGFEAAIVAACSKTGCAFFKGTVSYAVPGHLSLMLGHITLQVKARVCSDGCTWTFAGSLSALNDIFDFNPSTHRTRTGEALTAIGRIVDGTPYEIQFYDSTLLTSRGRCP